MENDEAATILEEHLLKLLDEDPQSCSTCVDNANMDGIDHVTECVDNMMEAINVALIALRKEWSEAR